MCEKDSVEVAREGSALICRRRTSRVQTKLFFGEVDKMSEAADLVLAVIAAVERRDAVALFSLYHEDIEFHDAPSLPYGGLTRGKKAVAAHMYSATGWLSTWDKLQPAQLQRNMDPRVLGDKNGEVVVAFRQRGISLKGTGFDEPALGLYLVRQNKLLRAQMFHFDTVALTRFLAHGGQSE
jgi:ketosteroid isomerase-like protein